MVSSSSPTVVVVRAEAWRANMSKSWLLHDGPSIGELREVLMRFLRSVGVVAGLVSAMGCGGVTVREVSPASPHSLRAITVERIQGCATEFGKELESGSYNIHSIVKVDPDGYKQGVEMEGIPDTAPNLATCVRLAVQDMEIPASVFNLRSNHSTASTNAPTVEQRSLMGNPAVVVIVVVGLGEIAIEAGAYTILLGVTVKVLEKAAEDVEEKGWKAVCIAKYAACVAAVGTWKRGNHLGISRCASCLETCKKEESWPSDIGNGSCEFWKRNWK